MTSINSRWIAGVENPEEFEKKMLEQKELFKRMYEILEQKAKANYAGTIKKGNYDSASWAERTADSIGYARCLDEMMVLLNYTQE